MAEAMGEFPLPRSEDVSHRLTLRVLFDDPDAGFSSVRVDSNGHECSVVRRSLNGFFAQERSPETWEVVSYRADGLQVWRAACEETLLEQLSLCLPSLMSSRDFEEVGDDEIPREYPDLVVEAVTGERGFRSRALTARAIPPGCAFLRELLRSEQPQPRSRSVDPAEQQRLIEAWQRHE